MNNPEEYPRIWSLTPSETKLFPIEKAGFWLRCIAYILDQVVLSIIGLLFFATSLFALRNNSYFQTGILSLGNFISALIATYIAMIFIKIAYFTYFHGHTGQTIGKMALGIKVVDTQGAIISYRRAFLRWVGYVISFLFFGLGFFWIAIDRNHQGWHDKIAQTYVIKT